MLVNMYADGDPDAFVKIHFKRALAAILDDPDIYNHAGISPNDAMKLLALLKEET